MFGDDFLSLIEHGGVVMYPLIACSVVSLAVVIERWWVVARAARRAAHLHRSVTNAWAQGGIADMRTLALRDASPLGFVYRAALSETAAAPDLRDRAARRHHAEVTRALKRFVWLLGTIGSLAPFIGLFGTVLGIIRSFEDMAATGSGGFAVVAAGISEALIATAGGLLVGVLAIFAYNALMVRIGNLSAQWRDWTDELLAHVDAAACQRAGQEPSGVQPH